MKKDTTKIKEIDVNGFNVLLVKSRPPRLEAKIVFDRDQISQKLLFTLMEISHRNGLGCSEPHFGLPNENSMTFLIGTILQSQKEAPKYYSRIYACLEEIKKFSEDLFKQSDFTYLDLTMFKDIDVSEIFPEQLAIIRDQNYNGSWQDFYHDLIDGGKKEEADIISRCIQFETNNNKDIGLVGNKLEYTLIAVDLWDAQAKS